jgi:putative transposase
MQEMFRRRHLPHWDQPGATYFITACLAGSIPAQGLLDIRNLERQLLATRPKDISLDEKDLVRKKLFVEQEKWLDLNPAVRHLENPELAKIVCDALLHFANHRYELVAWVVMPSHFHWLIRPLDDWAATLPVGKSAREVIMQSVKSFTAHQCNRILHQAGPFWQQESFDHCVRDHDELERILNYIEYNPVRAGLCARSAEWPYSSAYRRHVG